MSADLLRPLLPRYGLAAESPLRLLNRSENETWLAGDALVMRLHRQGYHSRAEIASELVWLSALQDLPGLRCVAPVADDAGNVLQEAEGRYVVGFAPIAAQELRMGDDLARWFGPLGEISARLHAQSCTWMRPPGFTRKRWDLETILGKDPHWGHWRDAHGLDTAGATVLARVAQDLGRRLEGYGTGPEVFGLVHADLRLTNVMQDGEGLWVIDFDDCGFSWWMYDLAAAVSFIETDARVPGLVAAWCAGYQRAGAIRPEDRAMIPTLIMLRRVLLTAWLGSRADSDTAQALGGPAFTAGTVDLADRFLTDGLSFLIAG